MLAFLKYVWRWWYSKKMLRKNVKVSPKSIFNRNTIFEGNNVIARNVMIGNTHIGRNTYIGRDSYLPNCFIGRFCSISTNVKLVSDTHPSSVFVSTCPSFFSTLKQNGQTFVMENKFNERLRIDGYSLKVGNDVWIGANVIIKGGITIGDGAIVAMGAVVNNDVPPYAIVGGVPAKILKYRFTEKQIEQLESIQWWEKPDKWLQSHAVEFENIELFLERN